MELLYATSGQLGFMPPPKAVLFDMDGTLVHLHPTGRKVVLNETLAHFGLPPISDDSLVDRFWFTSERYTIIDGWGVERIDFWKAFDNERMLQLQMTHTSAFEDVAENLAYLRDLDLRLGVVSNSAHVSLGHKLKLLEEHSAGQHFEVVVSCNDDVPRTKPFADGIELALARLGVGSHETVLVGDSLDDIGAGAAANVPVLIVNRGQIESIFASLEKHAREVSFGVIDSLYDLPRALGLADRFDQTEQAA
jgi:HAD superfamily hydrolase (TIGR01549 family)